MQSTLDANASEIKWGEGKQVRHKQTLCCHCQQRNLQISKVKSESESRLKKKKKNEGMKYGFGTYTGSRAAVE